LFGHLGVDVMTGGLGDDIYGVNDAGDQIIEVEGQRIETVEATVPMSRRSRSRIFG